MIVLELLLVAALVALVVAIGALGPRGVVHAVDNALAAMFRTVHRAGRPRHD